MNTLVQKESMSTVGIYFLEAKYEFMRMLRTPSFAIPTLLFPPMFYVLFGVLLPSSRGFQAGIYLMATYTVFGVMAPGLFGFGVTVALELEKGWLRLKRVAPMPPGAYLLAKMLMAMLFALVIFCIVASLAATLGGVSLAPKAWATLAMIAVFGVVPFCALGLLVGTLVNAQAAPAIANLIYLPMAFLSGLWLPLAFLPKIVQQLAPLWPPYHLAQLALSTVGQMPDVDWLKHIGILCAITAGLFAAAHRRLSRMA